MADTNYNNTTILPTTPTGLTVTEDTIPNNITISTLAPTYTDTGHSVNFTTVENEFVMLVFITHFGGPSGAGTNLRYDLDGSDFPLMARSNLNTTDRCSIVKFLGPLTAGAHTLKIMAAKGNASNITIYGDSETTQNREFNLLQVIQFK
jgi:hypothetical protein